MAKYDVTTLGEILIDLTVVGKSENGSSLLEENPGGAPANVAASISKLGGKSAFIGKIGSDRFGDVALSALKNVGVDCSAVRIEEKQRTSVSFVSLGKNGERTFSFERGADTLLNSSEVSENLIASSKFLHIGSLSLTEESASSATREAIKLAKKFGTFISYDPNWREVAWSDSSLGIKTMKSIFPYADFVKLSTEELELIYGKNESNAAQNILNEGVRLVCVTLGKDGVFYKTQNSQGIISIPNYKIDAIDTTGAGDAFTGALLYRLTRRENPFDFTKGEIENDLNFANAAATLCVSRRGAIPSLASLYEVEKLLNMFTS